MTKTQIKSLDIETIKLIVSDTKNRLDGDRRVGQPFTVRHFENLKFVKTYLNRYLSDLLIMGIIWQS